MDDMNITSVQYKADPLNPSVNTSVILVADGETLHVPMDADNRHYAAVLKWVADGNTIQDAD